MGPNDEDPKKPRPPKPHTAPHGKPWLDEGRLALIMLEPAVERMLVMCASRYAIGAYCLDHGASEEQVDGLIRGIKARWRANEAAGREDRIAELSAQIDAAIYSAWNQPVMDQIPREEGGGKVQRVDANGVALTMPDLAALPKLLKLKAELHGLNAPSKHVVLTGTATAVAAMSPAERQAEIDQLLEKRRAAMGPATSSKSLTGKVIDVPG